MMTEEDFQKRIDLILRCAPDIKRALAIEYGVAESTVERWVSGVSCPLPRLRESICRWALRHAGERSYEDLP